MSHINLGWLIIALSTMQLPLLLCKLEGVALWLRAWKSVEGVSCSQHKCALLTADMQGTREHVR